MRTRPLLAVLDEPAAALDPASEYEFHQRYAEAAREWQHAKGGVALLVSHRFSTIRMAGLIGVLDGGRIIDAVRLVCPSVRSAGRRLPVSSYLSLQRAPSAGVFRLTR
ncbi:hypothetical protein AB0I81_24630 [Nonomuraea sp. NPDC050404]|uniref:hypothetical protein n=1 Tax=Nonomuraea sp. NPDC050404 TaxID=3155783 RepID=UPI0033FCB5C4